MLRHWFYDLAHGGEVGFFNPLAIHLRNLAAQGHPLSGTASEEHFAASSEVAAEAAFLSAMAYLLYAWVSFRDKGGRPIVEALSEASAMFYMAGTLYRVRSRMPEAKDHLGDDARYRASQVLEDSVQNLIGSRRL